MPETTAGGERGGVELGRHQHAGHLRAPADGGEPLLRGLVERVDDQDRTVPSATASSSTSSMCSQEPIEATVPAWSSGSAAITQTREHAQQRPTVERS
jgi:hypothetical protein